MDRPLLNSQYADGHYRKLVSNTGHITNGHSLVRDVALVDISSTLREIVRSTLGHARARKTCIRRNVGGRRWQCNRSGGDAEEREHELVE